MKKKMTLILLATLFVVAGSFAQTQRVLSQKHLPTIAQQLGKNEQQQPSMKSLQMLNSVEKQKGLRASVAAHNMLTGNAALLPTSSTISPRVLRKPILAAVLPTITPSSA